MKRIVLALSLIASLMATAFAQAPPPVPALPDTQRLTSYTITGTTCACAVGFAIYADGTDIDQWIQVWISGVRFLSTDPTHGWIVTSPTGPIGSIARPINDAVLTFNAVQTGTIQIVGARRPRRITQFSEGQGVAARDLNQALTDIVAENRENWDVVRGLFGNNGWPPTRSGTTNTLASVSGSLSAGNCLNADGNGNIVAGTGTCVSAGSGVSAATGGNVAFYPSTGSTVGGETLTSFIDSAICATQAAFLGRGQAAWACFTGFYTPDMFGAVGSSDDTTTLQTALTAIGTAGGGTLNLPRNGGYITQGLNVPANVCIVGPGTLTQKAGQINQIGFVVLQGNGSCIRKVFLNGQSGTNTTGVGVIIAANDTYIEDNTISGFISTGINNSDTSLHSFARTHITNNVISGNGAGGIGLQAPASGSISYVYIVSNTITGNVANQGILIDGSLASAALSYVKIIGNRIDNNGSGSNGGGGAWVNAGFDVIMSGNSLQANNGDHLECIKCTDVSVVGNVSIGALGPPGDPENSGIVMVGSGVVAISGNVVVGNSGPGILLTPGTTSIAASYITISGNTALNNSKHTAGNWAGIQCDTVGNPGNPNFINIIGNISNDSLGGSATQGWGIKLNNCTNANVAENRFEGNKTAPVATGGTNTGLVLRNNIGYNPVGPASVTPGASPWTYTAGASPENLCLSATTSVTAVTIGGVSVLAAALGANSNYCVPLWPNQAAIVTYAGTLTANKNVQ